MTRLKLNQLNTRARPKNINDSEASEEGAAKPATVPDTRSQLTWQMLLATSILYLIPSLQLTLYASQEYK